MSHRPKRSFPIWSLRGHSARSAESIARLSGRRGIWPLPGVPSSVKEPSLGSPVRSLGCRIRPHPVISPIRLLPDDVTGPAQSWVALRAMMEFFTRVVAKAASPANRPTAREELAVLSATVLLIKTISPKLFEIVAPPCDTTLRAKVVFDTDRVPALFERTRAQAFSVNELSLTNSLPALNTSPTKTTTLWSDK